MSFSFRKKLVTLALATAAATPVLGAVPASADSAAVAAIANRQVGKTCGSYYGCQHPTAWCSDFARWVWGQAGAEHTSALDARAVSFYEYGSKYGTFHSVPQVGDAVVYDSDGSATDGHVQHVNLVVKVSADGTKIQTVGGNESGGVRWRDWFDWKNNASPVGAGRALRFIGPKGLTDTAPPSGEPAPVSAVGDLTGDGKPDLLARAESGNGTLWIYPGEGDGHFGTRVDNGGWAAMERVTGVGDVTGDGKADVAAIEKSSGKLWIYPGQSNGHLGSRVDNGGGWGDIRVTGSKDLNGDGRGDLLAIDEASGKLWMYPGLDNGHFGNRVEAGSNWDSMNPVGSAGDLTGDGKNDVAAVEEASGKLFVYPGLGNGKLGTRIQAGTNWNVMSSVSGAGDYTGDGKDDLIARDNAGKLWVYPGQDNGQLGARIDNGAGWNFTS
ncbi:FG-GAP-like repeat-containing protein [Streptomyces purpureus]|uniref:FG-GAP-like repeat-containing protein n=1 Tax=Streptomyces purpureus TaxID=1951 RepID=UPI00036764E6|nr:FG-GAP-like repeat-containing protein [Streptomyces purpureus]